MPASLDASLAGPPAATRLSDYAPPAFLVDSIDLTFLLHPHATVVRSRLALRRNPAAPPGDDLVLDGAALTTGTILLDDAPIDPAALAITATTLTIHGVAAAAVLDVETTVDPAANSELSGLYLSNGAFFTQCEAQGFRRITWFPDRPDVMARYTATVVADAAACPVLLSNGDPVDRGTMPDGRHWVKWADPHPKPSYLFALVAGDLACVADHFVTRSGRTVQLGVYVRRGDEDRCGHAIDSLKRAMRWDEAVFGLEYDLGVFNIAAVSDFNMGAMENKGLNVFNTRYVLARPDTATDADYQGIETVIAHEYFHNWTGNRVTCRDWFQLTLKEGLTVFRDQEFSADQGSAAVKRIADVRRLRAAQFPEDAGPLAHPIRPAEYVKIDNFYTATVYQKGAEVIRMLRTLIGGQAFRAGMDLYFARHDNQAVTCEDFLAAMADASVTDLAQFRHWYGQAGTPAIEAAEHHDPATGRFTLTLRQRSPVDVAPLLIPVAMGLLDAHGQPLPTRLDGEAVARTGTRILLLREAEQDFAFLDCPTPPVPALLRSFSAPVKLAPAAPARLAFLAAHDPDPFLRWDAGQEYAAGVLLEGVARLAAGDRMHPDDGLHTAMRAVLRDAHADPAWAAEALTLPGEATLADRMARIDVDHIHQAREQARAELGAALAAPLRDTFAAMQATGAYTPDGAAIGRRALANSCMGYLAAAGDTARAVAQYRAGASMTDVLAALAVLNTIPGDARDAALADFHARWHHDELVLDKWFALQAVTPLADARQRVRALSTHADFSWRNPNRVRALFGSFAMANPRHFHAADGGGYALLADAILALDPINSQIAARLVPPLGQWARHTPGRQDAMQDALRRILAAPALSEAVAEMARRSLGVVQ